MWERGSMMYRDFIHIQKNLVSFAKILEALSI